MAQQQRLAHHQLTRSLGLLFLKMGSSGAQGGLKFTQKAEVALELLIFPALTQVLMLSATYHVQLTLFIFAHGTKRYNVQYGLGASIAKTGDSD